MSTTTRTFEVFIPAARIDQAHASIEGRNLDMKILDTRTIRLLDAVGFVPGEFEKVESGASSPARYVEVTHIIIVPRDEGDFKLLGIAEKDGLTTSLTADWRWSEERVGALDFCRCDRCHVRHQRHKIYVIQKSGEEMQVGGNCAVELNVIAQAEKLIRELSLALDVLKESVGYFDPDEPGAGFGGGSRIVHVDSFLLLAAAITKKYGFISTSKAEMSGHESTAVIVSNLYFDRRNRYAAFRTEALSALSVEERAPGYWSEKVDAYLAAQPWTEFKHNATRAMKRGTPMAILACLPSLALRAEVETRTCREETPVEGTTISFAGSVVDKKQSPLPPAVDLTVNDRKFGRLWFRTQAKGMRDAQLGDHATGTLTVKSVKASIAFGANLRHGKVEKRSSEREP